MVLLDVEVIAVEVNGLSLVPFHLVRGPHPLVLHVAHFRVLAHMVCDRLTSLSLVQVSIFNTTE